MGIGLEEINWVAVVASAFGVFMLGGVWYTALFGAARLKGAGWTPEHMEEVKKLRPPAVFFGLMMVAYVVMAVGIAALWGWCDVRTYMDGAFGGLFVWVVVAAYGFSGHLADDKKVSVWLIDAGFALVAVPAMGAVLGGWR